MNAKGIPNNGNVSNALLYKELQVITEKQNEMIAIQKQQGESLIVLVTGLAVTNAEAKRVEEKVDGNTKRIEKHDGEIDKIKSTNTWWSGANSIGTIIANILATIGLGR